MLGKQLTTLACFVAGAFAVSRTTPPSGAYVVAKSGGQYSTIQSAVDAVPKDTSGDYVIFVQPGTYEEQVLVPAMTGTLSIYGYTTDDQDYSKNEVTLTHNLGADDAGNNDASGTFRAKADYLKVYNLNIINSRGQGDQAIALSAYGEYEGFYGCQLIGYQDTVLSNDGHHVYRKCYIEGATDFIFGLRAIAWFDDCTIGIVGSGWITANGRDSEDNDSYYVLNSCTVVDEAGVGSGATYLGRPWRNYSRVVVQNSELGGVVNSAGWSIWNVGDERTNHVFYAEYGNSGPGAQGDRADFSFTLNAPVKLGDVLGSTEWIDMQYWDNKGSNGGGSTPTTTVPPTPTTTSSGGGCTQSLYGQCGGIGYTGCTNCVGSECKYQNDWYSQCL